MSFSLLPITAWHWKCWATNWKKAHRIQRKMKLLLKKKERKKASSGILHTPTFRIINF